MGQVFEAWSHSIRLGSAELFNGEDASIKALTDLLSGGKMIDGSDNGHTKDLENYDEDADTIRTLTRTFYGYFIPAIWSFSSSWTAVVYSGHDCKASDPLYPDYLSQNQSHKLFGCYQNKLYYLVAAGKGKGYECDKYECPDCMETKALRDCHQNYFKTPDGVDYLYANQTAYGGITVQDLIIG